MIEIAYTIGNQKSYNQALKNDPENSFKLGKSEEENYPGGYIWKTLKEAQDFINSNDFKNIDWGDEKPRYPKDFSVYEVELKNGWNKDTYLIEGNKHHNLLIDSKFRDISK